MTTPLAPLYAVTGVPGSGKSTILPELVQAAGEMVVADIDEILEKGRLLGVPVTDPEAESVWPAYRRLWHRITYLSRRAGHPVIFLSPDTPDEIEDAAAHLLLDRSDAVRAERLRARGDDERLIEAAIEDARESRERFDTVLTIDGLEPAVIASRVMEWVRSYEQERKSA
jgi:dephospho-CoA kinase